MCQLRSLNLILKILGRSGGFRNGSGCSWEEIKLRELNLGHLLCHFGIANEQQ